VILVASEEFEGRSARPTYNRSLGLRVSAAEGQAKGQAYCQHIGERAMKPVKVAMHSLPPSSNSRKQYRRPLQTNVVFRTQ
jgi:hypothetical protein